MDTKKIKEGISVKEIEGFAKKHRFVLFFALALLLSCLFSFVFFKGWTMLAAAAGGILGALFPQKFASSFQKIGSFFRKQEEVTQLILLVVGLGLAIFLPILTFFILGGAGGKYFHGLSMGECEEIVEISSEDE